MYISFALGMGDVDGDAGGEIELPDGLGDVGGDEGRDEGDLLFVFAFGFLDITLLFVFLILLASFLINTSFSFVAAVSSASVAALLSSFFTLLLFGVADLVIDPRTCRTRRALAPLFFPGRHTLVHHGRRRWDPRHGQPDDAGRVDDGR